MTKSKCPFEQETAVKLDPEDACPVCGQFGYEDFDVEKCIKASEVEEHS